MIVGILGYGSMGRRHAAHVAALGHDVAVYDPYLLKMSLPPGPHSLYISEEALLERATALVIASPVSEHARQLKAAWALSKNRVLVEKPLAESLAQFRNTPGPEYGMAMLGYNLRYHEGLRFVKRILDELLGTVYYANVWVRCNRQTWPGQSYGSTLAECSHEIDLALWLFGRGNVEAYTHSFDRRAWRVALMHDDGAYCQIDIDDDHEGSYDRGGIIRGNTGHIRWAWDAATTGRFKAEWEASGRQADVLSMTVLPDDTYRAEMRAFLSDAFRAGGCTGYEPDLHDGLEVLRIMEHVERGQR